MILLILVAIAPLVSAAGGIAQFGVKGWSPAKSQGWWCGEDCLRANAAKLVSDNMTVVVDPFADTRNALFPYFVVEGFYRADDNAAGDPMGVAIDDYGRFAPDLTRFPSSAPKGGKPGDGLGPVCAGLPHLLKCGMAIPLGIPRLAVQRKTPVKGAATGITADQIADTSTTLGPLGEVYALNMKNPHANAYIQSVVDQLNAWEVKYLLLQDAYAAGPHAADAIVAFSKAINATTHAPVPAVGGDVVLAVAGDPAQLTDALFDQIQYAVNTYRVTNDMWDTWADVVGAMDVVGEWMGRHAATGCIDAQSPVGVAGCNHWPDLGELPIGRIGAKANESSSYPPWHKGSCTAAQLGCGKAGGAPPACCPRQGRLKFEESRTLYTIAMMSRSAAILGGSLLGQSNSMHVMSLFTNAYYADIFDPWGAGNGGAMNTTVLNKTSGSEIWVSASGAFNPMAFDAQWFVAVYNKQETTLNLNVSLDALPLDLAPYQPAPTPGKYVYMVRDVWLNAELGGYAGYVQIGTDGPDKGAPMLDAHGVLLFMVSRIR